MILIRKMRREDYGIFLELTSEFYASDAVKHDIPKEFHKLAFDEIMRSDVYQEGYILEYNGQISGYSLLANSFSHEMGGKIMWIEEIYIRLSFQGKGIAGEFLRYLEENRKPDLRRLRLEVTSENERAANIYKKRGYRFLEYCQMVKDF